MGPGPDQGRRARPPEPEARYDDRPQRPGGPPRGPWRPGPRPADRGARFTPSGPPRPQGGRPWAPAEPGDGAQRWAPQVGPIPASEQLGADEELVAGRRPVEEAFAARRQARRLLVTPQRRQALERLVLHATTLRIPIVEVEGGTLTAIAGFDGHQGIALVVEPRHFASPEEILARAIERGEAPFVLVLDSLEDPQNLGTLLRSAEGAGVHGVIFPTVRQAPLSPAAIKASAGATEHLLLCPVDDLAAALTDLHVRGLQIVGTEAGAPLTARQADLRGPIAIVIGSEGQGLAPVIRRRCDLMVRIPMRGAIGSLNAAVAGSVLLFEALGQREPDARPASPAPAVKGAPPPDAPAAERGAVEPENPEAAVPKARRAPSTRRGAASGSPADGPPAGAPARPKRASRARAVDVAASPPPEDDLLP